eukprot:gene6177-7155_t
MRWVSQSDIFTDCNAPFRDNMHCLIKALGPICQQDHSSVTAVLEAILKICGVASECVVDVVEDVVLLLLSNPEAISEERLVGDLMLERSKSFHDVVDEEQCRRLSVSGGAHNVTKNVALGGSVTYGSLAANSFGETTSYIVTTLGGDIDRQFDKLIVENSIGGSVDDNASDINGGKQRSIDLSFVERSAETKNTSYQLNYYNHKKNRTLLLLEKGADISVEASLRCLREVRPDAIFLVPVSDELNERLFIEVVKCIEEMRAIAPYTPIVAFDVQGFLRTFNGSMVTTRTQQEMVDRLEKMSRALEGMDIVSVIKAEYGEAVAILGDQDPGSCARMLRERFGFSIASVTMGGDGGFVSSRVTGEVYIPTFKPAAVQDETGCGDTFLTCTVLELLNTIKSQHQPTSTAQDLGTTSDDLDIVEKLGITSSQVIGCLEVGSAGASFLVEQMGPKGFTTRSKILERIQLGHRQNKAQYLQWNRPAGGLNGAANQSSGSGPSGQKLPKSTTHYSV